MKRMSRFLTRTTLVAAIVGAGAPARATPSAPSSKEVERPHANLWGVKLVASYATAGEFQGIGAAIQLMGKPLPWLATGLMADFTRLRADGISADNNMPYEEAFLSKFVGGFAQLRAPVLNVEPYLELALGYATSSVMTSVNTQCQYRGGFAISGALGFDLSINRAFSLGPRWSVRSLYASGACGAVGGPATPDYGPLMHSFGLAATYGW